MGVFNEGPAEKGGVSYSPGEDGGGAGGAGGDDDFKPDRGDYYAF